MTELCQFPTPLWVAEALVERHFPRLDHTDLVLEPSCGPGAFLQAVPPFVPAIGIDIDPTMAALARAQTGREIISGDFLEATLHFQPTAIIGNPPFSGRAIDAFLARCHEILPEGGRVGFILPSYAFRTAARVVDLLDRWSLSQEMLPRSAFCHRMREPLVFALFSKDVRRLMVGFALYEHETDRQQMGKRYRELLANQQGSAWRAVCKLALQRLGGDAQLTTIYSELESNRPSRTQWWREKIRQTLRTYPDFIPVRDGHYRLRGAA